jgi:hypothetical protein
MQQTGDSMLFAKNLIAVGLISITGLTNAAGWKTVISNNFTSDTEIVGWDFSPAWNPNGFENPNGLPTDYIIQDGYLELRMVQTNKGGIVFSPKFVIDGAIKITVNHYMHQEGGNPYLGHIELRDETSINATATSNPNFIQVGFQNSSSPYDYQCSSINIPRVYDSNGCIPKQLSSTTTSSSLYDKWITTVITYNPQTGKITVDYENDKIIDFIGAVTKAKRFTPTRVAMSGYGWFTGHYHRIDSVKIESVTTK